jgi:hypothetical protein
MKIHEYNEMMSYLTRRPMSMGGLSFKDQGFEPLPITERNKIKKRFPNKKLDFKKYRFGMPKSDPDYETARYVGKRYEQRKERTIRESKDPIKVEQKRLKAKEYYSTEKENILERARKKYEVSDEYRKQVAAQNKKTQVKIVSEKGIFPPGQKPQDNIWHDLYRSSQAKGGDNRFILNKKFIDNVPKKEDGTPRWAKDNYYRTLKFKDTKTGKTITYNGMKKYLNETFGKGTYEKALDGYKLKENLRDTRIKIRGKEQKLGTALRDAVRAQGNPNVFSALEVHHPFGIKENWWNNEVVFRDANRNLNLINNRLTRAARNIKNDADRQKLLNKFGKEVDKLPGGISLFFEGQQVGTKVPTSESVLRGAAQTVKDPALTRAINKKLTALQELASRTGAGVDPILAAKAGYEEIVKPAGKGLLTALKVLGQPSVAAAFAADELSEGNIKTAGASLLAPELVGSAAPKGTSLLSKAGRLAMNPFGRAARAFTPVGLATIGAGAAYDLYKEFERRQALTDEERLDEDLEAQEKYDEMMVGAADGGLITGRMGFAEGPKDPSRRKFIKIMGGLASLPIVGKYFKFAEKAAPVVQQLKNTTTTMPEWFPSFIDKVINRGVGKKIDADLMEYEVKELPGIKVTKSDDGRVFVEGQNDYYKSYEIDYTPPGYEVIDEKTGKAVKRPGDFMAQEEVPVNVDPDGNADFDAEVLEDLDQILGSDTRTMEEFATGKSVKGMKSGEFAVGRAEAQADAAKDFDDFYED